MSKKLRKNIGRPLSNQLIEILKDLILKGNYKAGDPFLTENEIAESKNARCVIIIVYAEAVPLRRRGAAPTCTK